MKYDLNIHTTYSDGELTFKETIEKAISLGLDGIAICDHDNIDSWKEIDETNAPIDLIKGVELSTYYNGENIHILGYYLNNGTSYKELEDFLFKIKNMRKQRTIEIITLLKNIMI